MKTYNIICFCICLLHPPLCLSQQALMPFKEGVSSYYIDLASNALQLADLNKADQYLSLAITHTLDNKDTPAQDLRFLINYCADKIIFNNIFQFQALLSFYAEMPLPTLLQNTNQISTLYLSYHEWLIYNHIPLRNNHIDYTIYDQINLLWYIIITQIESQNHLKNIIAQTSLDELIFNDGLLPSLELDRFWCNYFKADIGTFEHILTDFVTKLNQYECKDRNAYLIQIADRLSLFNNASIEYARTLYAVIGSNSIKWREYAISQVGSLSCMLGDINAVMPLYAERLFSNYEYTDLENYYTDVCAVSPFLEPSIAINVVQKAYETIKNEDISDKDFKCCTLLTILGTQYYELHQFSDAETYLIQALAYTTPYDKVAPIHTLLTLGSIYAQQGDLSFAIDLYKMVLQEQYAYNPYNTHTTLYELYRLHSLQGDIQLANSYLSQTLKVFKERIQDTFLYLPTQERLSYWNSHTNWGLFSNLHETSPKIEYDIQLLNKGILLQTDINIAESVYQSNDAELIQSYTILLSIKDTHSPRRHQLEREFLQSFRNTQIDNTLSFTNTTYKDIQSCLGTSDIAIEFAHGYKSDSSLYYIALVLRKDWNGPQMIPLCTKDDIEQLCKINLEDEKWRSNSFARKDLDVKYFKKGYSLIWSKLEPYINEGDNVYFSPSGLLHQINVEVLKDSIGRQANEKYNLYRVSSTRQLCIEKPKIKYTNATLYGGLIYEMDTTQMIAQSRTYHSTDDYVASRGFVANSTMRREGWNYLPATKSEVEMIARQMYEHGIRPERYTETIGTEESFKALSGKQIPIIHLATHGFFLKDEEAQKQDYFQAFNLDHPMNIEDTSLKRSGLILAGGQQAWLNEPIPANVEDGILLAEEIATIDLSGTDLVVLSACQTGLGEITSEGVFGLQRAFKKAGVQTLIMSLWRVHDDATSLMMQTFYEHLLSGQTKREAFVFAQQTVKEKYTDPYYWAAFIMLD